MMRTHEGWPGVWCPAYAGLFFALNNAVHHRHRTTILFHESNHFVSNKWWETHSHARKCTKAVFSSRPCGRLFCARSIMTPLHTLPPGSAPVTSMAGVFFLSRHGIEHEVGECMVIWPQFVKEEAVMMSVDVKVNVSKRVFRGFDSQMSGHPDKVSARDPSVIRTRFKGVCHEKKKHFFPPLVHP